MYLNLDSLLLSQPRLSIMCFLQTSREADFLLIREKTNISAGNLSIQLNKLKKAGYLEIVKKFKGNYPHTICRITSIGDKSVEDFFSALATYRTTHFTEITKELNENVVALS